jgi:hypothetical protein
VGSVVVTVSFSLSNPNCFSRSKRQYIMSQRHNGHVLFLRNHAAMHPRWNVWPQDGRVNAFCSSVQAAGRPPARAGNGKHSMHTAQRSSPGTAVASRRPRETML